MKLTLSQLLRARKNVASYRMSLYHALFRCYFPYMLSTETTHMEIIERLQNLVIRRPMVCLKRTSENFVRICRMCIAFPIWLINKNGIRKIDVRITFLFSILSEKQNNGIYTDPTPTVGHLFDTAILEFAIIYLSLTTTLISNSCTVGGRV